MKHLLQKSMHRGTAVIAVALVLVLGLAVFTPSQNAAAANPLHIGSTAPAPKLCMEIENLNMQNGTWIRAANCVTNKLNQLFYWQPTSVPNVYRLVSYLNSNKCLDVSGAARYVGAQLIVYTCVPSAYEQEFKLTPVTISGTTHYQLRPTHVPDLSKCLGTEALFTHGAPIRLQNCTDNTVDTFWAPTQVVAP